MVESLVLARSSIRKTIGLGAGAVACATVVLFGLYLLYLGQSQNVATWGTLTTLDALICYNCLKAKSESAWLPGGYSLGAGIVTIASFYNATWQLGIVETFTTMGVVGILALRTILSPRHAIIAGVVIMTIGSIPLFYDNWVSPFHPSWWMWSICGVCNFVALFATKRWSIEDSLFSGVGGALNFIMFILVMR